MNQKHNGFYRLCRWQIQVTTATIAFKMGWARFWRKFLHCNPLQENYRVELLHREISVVITGNEFTEYNFLFFWLHLFPCFINIEIVAIVPVMCTGNCQFILQGMALQCAPNLKWVWSTPFVCFSLLPSCSVIKSVLSVCKKVTEQLPRRHGILIFSCLLFEKICSKVQRANLTCHLISTRLCLC